VFPSHRSCC